MGSKQSRRRRKKDRKSARAAALDFADVHFQTVFEGMSEFVRLLAEMEACPDPLEAVDDRIGELTQALSAGFAAVDPFSAIEVIRMICLPFSAGSSHSQGGVGGGPAIAELLGLAAVTASSGEDAANLGVAEQEVSRWISEEAVPAARELIDLAAVRDLLAAKRLDPMEQISASIRGSGRWLRSTSYPDMQENVLRGLLGGLSMDAILEKHVGFTVREAISVLETVHDLQIRSLNQRAEGLADAFNSINMAAGIVPTDEEKIRVGHAFAALFAPTASYASVTFEGISASTGLSITTVGKVVDFFAFKLDGVTTTAALDSFLSGNSPFQQAPLIWRGGEHLALIHPALIYPAIKDGLEGALKNSAAWDTYQANRGKYLEGQIAVILARVLPGALEWHDVEYFVPDNQDETGDPSEYTKLVEGDHLFVLDDVAVIVEDKAIPLTARSRSGELNPLRHNLAKAITNGAEQAARLRDRIVSDHSLRLRSGEIVDLSSVREVHTIVTSLDDLSGISTATAQLLQAGILPAGNIPWTVSLNDLDLITRLTDRPAEFLLYLRRRRHPEATVKYRAVDEMDLFLYFFREGLYVEPDPDMVAAELEWMPRPSAADRRRRARESKGLITSQTDQLDAWHFSLHPPSGAPNQPEPAVKPTMTKSALDPLIARIGSGVFGWTSLGATLLSGATAAQTQLARLPDELLGGSRTDGTGRSVAIPWGTSKADGWLLVWMTRPAHIGVRQRNREAEMYMRLKKHQLGLARGAAFVYDEPSGELMTVIYDGDYLDGADPAVAAAIEYLRPPAEMEKLGNSTSKRRQ